MSNPPPRRRPNAESRGGREHLTEDEVEAVIRAAGRDARHGHRNQAMILTAYTHVLRASEVVSLRWEKLNQKDKTIYIQRCKGSISGAHLLRDREIKSLRKLGWKRSGPVFVSQQGTAMTTNNFHQIIARAGRLAKIGLPIHSHMLRHGCGFRMTNRGIDLRVIQDWMGHANIQNTVGYTKLAANRFLDARIWED